ncbi:hypothetical protein Glove_199g49 [Diversispora epigaea]|uniref:TLDc domain-containing protein n=1 Tax=Diversispora epigaea TaxID=1348612 RepID=A0A397IK64_9GLOM|nr:hypothetical protein Glove_199g49 [Diversispora epigaea]
MCHGHAGTIVVVKVAGTDEIVGSYNPLAWNKLKSGFKETNNSFIFSLKNDNIKNSILSRVKPSDRLHYPMDRNMYGPWFVFDFAQEKQCQYHGIFYYEKSIRATDELFSIVDYEVFKVIKEQNPNCAI